MIGGIYECPILSEEIPKEHLEKTLFKCKLKNEKLLSEIGGGWTETISFDGKEFWNRK